MNKLLLLTFGILLFIGGGSNKVLAHQSGCHRWHSCPSDHGTYICGDLGYSSECGSDYYDPTPYFSLPIPINPLKGLGTFEPNSENTCLNDVVMKWDKPISGDRFSINISKKPGEDPGPKADTSDLSFRFSNVEPGQWYINLKTGNSERWTSVSYWTVDVPKIDPYFTAAIERRGDSQYLSYNSKCMIKFDGPADFNKFLETNNAPKSGEFALNYPTPTELTIKAWNRENKEFVQKLSYEPLPSPAPSASPIVDAKVLSESEGNSSGTYLFLFVIVGMVIGTIVTARKK